jgi:hypothetical protein
LRAPRYRRSSRARNQKHLVLVANDIVDRERDRGGRHIDDGVDLVDIDPAAHDIRADIGLVLVIGAEDLDLESLCSGPEVLDRHARRDHGALPRYVRIESRHVIHDADLDGAVAVLRVRHGGAKCDRKRREADQMFHWRSPFYLRWKARISSSPQADRGGRHHLSGNCLMQMQRAYQINMASSGNGTTSHVSGELFKMMAAVDMVHVPYRGGAPALTDLIGGQVQVMLCAHLDAAYQGRQAARAGSDRDTLGRAAGLADGGRFRVRLRGQHVVWRRCAQEHTH